MDYSSANWTSAKCGRSHARFKMAKLIDRMNAALALWGSLEFAPGLSSARDCRQAVSRGGYFATNFLARRNCIMKKLLLTGAALLALTTASPAAVVGN